MLNDEHFDGIVLKALSVEFSQTRTIQEGERIPNEPNLFILTGERVGCEVASTLNPGACWGSEYITVWG